MKNRIKISNIVALAAFLVSKPGNESFFAMGVLLAGAGEMIRIIASATIVKSSRLTREGVYSAVRNPLYLGTMLIMLGFLFAVTNPAHPLRSAAAWAMTVLSFAAIYRAQIKSEEEFLRSRFGKEFEDYRQNVNSLFPPVSKATALFSFSSCSMESFRRNKEYRGIAGTAAVFTLVWLRILYGL